MWIKKVLFRRYAFDVEKENGVEGSGASKNVEEVTFPKIFAVETSDGRKNYELRCVVHHLGQDLNSGHWYCHCKHGDK